MYARQRQEPRPGHPSKENMWSEFSQIGAFEDGEVISRVRFSCGVCGLELLDRRTEELGSLEIAQILQLRCPRDGEDLGFMFLTDRGGDRPDKLERLCSLLVEELKDHKLATRMEIESILKDRNLRVLFK